MREMKDSGVAWIGEIPTNWNVVRIKNLIATRDGGAWGDEASGKDGDMICLRIADFNYPQYRFDDKACLTIRHYKKDIINRLALKKGDILIEKSGGGEKTPVGRAVIFDKEYPALYANFMDRLRCKFTINPYWVLYNFANLYANNYTKPYIKQTTGIQNLDLQALMNSECFAMPPHELQNVILENLEKDSMKVDTLITNNETQIEKLKQYKQSLITEVVTRGLDPTVPMKDSGVEWIGKIPETWDTIRVKQLLKERKERSTDGLEEPLSMSQKVGLVPTKMLDMIPNMASSFIGAKLTYVDDLVFNKLKAHLGVFSVSKYDGLVSPDYAVYYSTGKTHLKYLEYLFKTPQCISEFRKRSTGVAAGLTRLYTDGRFAIECPFPDMEEQIALVEYLDTKCTQIDRLITIKQAKIEKLSQYKKSLIYEYVTGKKEAVSTSV